MAEQFVEGWTERIRDQLFVTPAGTTTPVPLDLTNWTVQLLLYDVLNVPVAYSGTAGIDTALQGIVYFDPAPTDLLARHSPYSVRWKVTDNAGKVAFFPVDPLGAPEQWIVWKP